MFLVSDPRGLSFHNLSLLSCWGDCWEASFDNKNEPLVLFNSIKENQETSNAKTNIWAIFNQTLKNKGSLWH